MPFMRTVLKVAMGMGHSAFVTMQHQLFTAGSNQHGQLGLGCINMSQAGYPTLVTSLSQHHVIDVCCGDSHTLALTKSKALFVFGSNEQGQLGLQNCLFSDEPKRCLASVDAIFAGGDQSFAV